MRPDETKSKEQQPARAAKRRSARGGAKAKAEGETKGGGGAAEQSRQAGGPLDDARVVEALRAAGDKKAAGLVVLDLRAVASFTDYFLIASGANARQVQAIADEVVERLKRDGTRALRVEGYRTAEWVLLDYGDFIFHVFEEKARRFYDLERLWRDAARVELPPELAGEPAAGGGRPAAEA
jgi:ribosome-associated protein